MLIFTVAVLSIVAALGWPLWQLVPAVTAMTVLPLTNPLRSLLRLIPSLPRGATDKGDGRTVYYALGDDHVRLVLQLSLQHLRHDAGTC